MENTQLLAKLESELKRTKGYFPFRIVWGYIGENGELEVFANVTKRQCNDAVRTGKEVFAI